MATCRECLHYEVCNHYKFEETILLGLYETLDNFKNKDIGNNNADLCKHFTPKSDYVKRERGEWKYNFDTSYLVRCDCRIKCTKCGHMLSRLTGVNYKFCPNCGADMRKEDNNA